jgi:hypothetical protein
MTTWLALRFHLLKPRDTGRQGLGEVPLPVRSAARVIDDPKRVWMLCQHLFEAGMGVSKQRLSIKLATLAWSMTALILGALKRVRMRRADRLLTVASARRSSGSTLDRSRLAGRAGALS